MCGFIGELTNNLIDKNKFLDLLHLSKHRGPDQQDIWKDKICQVGFNRLSILDLSENGKQPLVSPSNKFVLVFNGEVYNYKELQIKYDIAEKDLRSQSDSEILAHLVEKVSIEKFAQELNGMFAISIYDIENNNLFLIRDFAGIKPLFYGIHPEGIVFASQFDQVFCHPQFKQTKKLRPDIMKEYFGLGYMHAPNTVFENIYQVEPGQIITWNFNNKEITHKTQYFNWETVTENAETNQQTIDKLEIIFSKVIKSQLHADVPIATFLSGGIDSPLVTAFSKMHQNDIKAFTFGINNPAFNESEVASKIANHLRVKQTIKTIEEKKLISIINEHFNYLSEPFGDYSSIPTYLITQQAKKYATVMMAGDGGDELFWGYPRFLKSLANLHWFQCPLWLRKTIVPFYRKLNKKTSSAIDVFDNFEDWILGKQIHLETINQLMPNNTFSHELLASYKYIKGNDKNEALIYLKKNEFYAHLQKVLRKVDLMSMANSLEVRVPFLDKNMINFSNTIKPEYGITHKTPKIVLRKLLTKFVSQDLTELPKKGFSVPLESWLKNELKDEVINTLNYDTFFGNELINKDCFNQIITDFYSNKKNVNAWGIWHLYAWQKWANCHIIDNK